jgi:hypothetical protein
MRQLKPGDRLVLIIDGGDDRPIASLVNNEVRDAQFLACRVRRVDLEAGYTPDQNHESQVSAHFMLLEVLAQRTR